MWSSGQLQTLTQSLLKGSVRRIDFIFVLLTVGVLQVDEEGKSVKRKNAVTLATQRKVHGVSTVIRLHKKMETAGKNRFPVTSC